MGAQLEFNKGVNLNARDDDGLTPLYYAVNAVNADMVQLLIAEGANINELDDNGLTLLEKAEAEGKKMWLTSSANTARGYILDLVGQSY